MKLLLVRLQILLIVLLALSPLLYLAYKHFTPQINLWRYDYEHQASQNPQLPYLRTQGSNIVDDAGRPVLLRGVNLISTNWGGHYSQWNPQAIPVAKRDWHANVIRSRLYEHEYRESPASFFLNLEKQILEPARREGLYVILHPWFGENVSLPDSDGVQMWLAVAKRYKDDPHIIYDLLAEPRDISFEELQNTYLQLIPQVRAISPHSLIMVTGLDWGRDINAWLSSPLPYENLVYRANPYNRAAEFPGYFGRIAEEYPVFLGEFGTDDKLSMSESDVKNLLGYANNLNLGWTAWHFSQTGCPCLLSDEGSYTPSNYGQLVKSALEGVTFSSPLIRFDADKNKLYVYSDFLESGFADYSWGITNQLGSAITTNFHSGSGLYLNTSRRIQPSDYQSFHLTLQTRNPEDFTLRFKSYNNQLSESLNLKAGENTIETSQINLESISGIVIETRRKVADSTPLSLDNIYFQK